MKSPALLRTLFILAASSVAGIPLHARQGGNPVVTYTPPGKVAQNANGGNTLVSPNSYTYTLGISMPGSVPAGFTGTALLVPSLLSDPTTGLQMPTPSTSGASNGTGSGEVGATTPFSIVQNGNSYTVVPVAVTASTAVTLYGLDQTANPIFTVSDGVNQYQLLYTIDYAQAQTLTLMFRAVNSGAITVGAINTVIVQGTGAVTVANPPSTPAITYITLNTFTTQSINVTASQSQILYGIDQTVQAPFTVTDGTTQYQLQQTTSSPIAAGTPTALVFEAVQSGAITSAAGSVSTVVPAGYAGTFTLSNSTQVTTGMLGTAGSPISIPVLSAGSLVNVQVVLNFPAGAEGGDYGYYMTGVWPNTGSNAFAVEDFGATVNATVVPPAPTLEITGITAPNIVTAFTPTPSPVGSTTYNVPSNPVFQIATGQTTTPVTFTMAGATSALTILSLTGDLENSSTGGTEPISYTIQTCAVTTGGAATLYGLDQTAEPVFTVSDGTHQYQLLNTTTFGTAGTLDLAFQAVQAGAISSTLGTITQVVASGDVQLISGVTVTNLTGPDQVGIDAINLDTSLANGFTTVDLEAGTYTVTFTAANCLYPLNAVSQTVTFTVNPAVQTQTIATPAISLTLTNPYTGQTVTAYSDQNAGSMVITIPAADTNSPLAVPYSLSGAATGGTLLNAITSASVVINGATAPLYSLLNALGLNLTNLGVANGTVTGTGSLTQSILGLGLLSTGLSPGTYTVVAQDNNDSVTQAGGTAAQATINVTVQTMPTLTITASSAVMTYGGAVPTLSVSYSGFVNGDGPGNLSTLPTVGTTVSSSTAAGTYAGAVVASGAVDSNYAIVYVAGSVTVNPASLVITAGNGSMTYGGSAPALSVANYSGFVNGDTSAKLSAQAAVTTTASSSSAVGTYPSTASGAKDPNYTISYLPGTVTVNPASLTITAAAASMTYGGSLPAFTATYSGFVNGDTSAKLTTQPTLSCSTAATSAAGTYTGVIKASGAVDPNYTITYAPGTLTIAPAPLTITASSATIAQGAAIPAFTATYSGFVNGDTSASLSTKPTITTTATASSAPGTYPITVSGAADSNYAITYVAGTLTITGNTACSAPTVSTTGSFSGSTSGCQGNTLWFNSSVNVSGVSAQGSVLQFSNSTVSFLANGKTVTLVAPSATITFSATATQATSTYNSATNTWTTTAPAGYTGNVFLTGLSYAAPSNFSAANNTVTWTGSFLGSTQNMSVQWLWTASVLSQCSSNYNTCGVKPCDSGSYCSYHNSDSAGTCENYKSYNNGTACSNGSSSSSTTGTAISGLYPTGVSATGSLLGGGASDSHYTVTASSLGSKYLGAGYVDPQSLANGWVADTSSAQWITAPGGVNIGNGAGNNSLPATGSASLSDTYDYTTTFTMPANATVSTASISGTISADDTVIILVNGAVVSTNVPQVGDNQYNVTRSFTLNSNNASFQSGVNTLVFRVCNENTPTPTNASGLYVQSIGGTVSVPANTFAVTYCANLSGQGTQSAGSPPAVTPTSPTTGSTYPFAAGSSATIPVAFTAVSPANSGNITAISATLNGAAVTLTTTTGVGSSATATGAATLTISTAGSYTLVYTGTNATGSATASVTFTTVQVAPPTITINAPANGATITIPYGSSTASVPYTFSGGTAYAAISSVVVTLNGSAVTPSVTGLNTTSVSGSGTLSLTAGTYALSATDSNGVATGNDVNSFTVVQGDCGGGTVSGSGCDNEFLVWVQQSSCSGQYAYNNGCSQTVTGGSIVPIAFSVYSGSSSSDNCWGSASSKNFVTDTSIVIAIYQVYSNGTSSNPTLYSYSATGPNPPYYSIANNQYELEFPTAAGSNHYQIEVYSDGQSLQLLGCEDLYTSGSCMPSSCSISTSTSSSIGSGNCVWFDSCVSVNGLSSHYSTLWFDTSTISFTCGGKQVSLACPAACIKFDPNCSSATTTFDTVANCWVTDVPLNYSGNVFLCAVPYTCSSNLNSKTSVTWNGCFRSDTSSLNVQWQWSASAYSQCNSSNYNSCDVKPVDSGSYCSYRNSDSAGTPETYRNYQNSSSGTNGFVGYLSPSVGSSCWLDSSWNSSSLSWW